MNAPRVLPAAAVVLALGVLVGGGYCAGAQHATAADAKHETAALQHVYDSVAVIARRDSVRFDSLRAAARPDSAHLDTLIKIVSMKGPGMIAVDTSTAPSLRNIKIDDVADFDISPRAPPVLVHVPTQVTDLIQTQARQITELRAELVVADSGWAAERTLRINREATIHVMQSKQSWCGFKCGAVVTLVTLAGAAYVVNKLEHRATPATGRVVELGARMRF